jgi:hypothetical protein
MIAAVEIKIQMLPTVSGDYDVRERVRNDIEQYTDSNYDQMLEMENRIALFQTRVKEI